MLMSVFLQQRRCEAGLGALSSGHGSEDAGVVVNDSDPPVTAGADTDLDVYLVHWIRFMEAFQVRLGRSSCAMRLDCPQACAFKLLRLQLS
jgi:hypothetical protein